MVWPELTLSWGGDFNCIMDATLDKNSSSSSPASTDQYRNRLRAFMEDRGLHDVFRVRYPSRKGYTFRRGSYASRLDIILLSAHLTEAASPLKIRVGAQSDHSLISIIIHASERKRGPGRWKFNPMLLQNASFVQMMSDFLQTWIPPPELTNPCSKWDWLKHKIKRKSIEFSRDNPPAEKQMIRVLSRDLQSLTARADRGEDVLDQLLSVRRELAEVEELRANNLIL